MTGYMIGIHALAKTNSKMPNVGSCIALKCLDSLKQFLAREFKSHVDDLHVSITASTLTLQGACKLVSPVSL